MKTTKFFAAIIAAFTLFSVVGCTDGPGVSLNDDVTFDITVSEIGSTSATVSVDPSDDTVIYYFDKVTKASYKTYDSDLEFMKARIAALRVYCEEMGVSLVQSLSVGEAMHTYSGELAPSTDYYIFAFAVDAKLNPISDLSLKAFKTDEGKTSNNTFSVNVVDGVITITPSNNDQYFWDITPSYYYEGKTDDFIMTDLVDYYKDQGGLSSYLVSGVDTFDMSEYLTPGETYTVYVFGYEDAPTTGITEYTFTYNSTSGGGNTGGDETTTLTGDVAINVAAAEAYYYGDLYENGCNDWDLYLYNDLETLYVEFLTALNSTSPVGTYTVVPWSDNITAGNAIAGEFDDEGYIWPSYYLKYDSSDKMVAYALITSGTVSVTKSGSNYTVVANLADELGNKITVDYTGAMVVEEGEIVEETSMSSKGNIRAARKALRHFSSAAKIRPAAKTLRGARLAK